MDIHGENPAKGHRDASGLGASVRQGGVRAGTVGPGEEKAQVVSPMCINT